MSPTRRIEVAPERLERWLAGFGERHDGVVLTQDGPVTHARGGDGSVAVCEPFGADPLALVLVRRGGYAVGLASGGRLLAHKCGTRYVQSRTAAGGWSQQRYARRRGNQADELVGAVAEHAARVLGEAQGAHGIPAGLVLGGDRALAGQVLEDARLAALADLPRRTLYDLPDPGLKVLQQAAERARAVRIELTET
ncbi:acVLRF1 family peptidyl-tRNA hydrolase [Actinomycetota bacterium]